MKKKAKLQGIPCKTGGRGIVYIESPMGKRSLAVGDFLSDHGFTAFCAHVYDDPLSEEEWMRWALTCDQTAMICDAVLVEDETHLGGHLDRQAVSRLLDVPVFATARELVSMMP